MGIVKQSRKNRDACQSTVKILCVADEVDNLIHSARIKERLYDVDLVLGAGDLPMRYLGYITGSLNKRLFFVFGNHDLKYLRQFEDNSPKDWITNGEVTNHFGSTYIDSKCVIYKGILIAGLGGSRCYNHGRNQFKEYQMVCRILQLVPKLLWNRIRRGRYIDILLTHSPPLKIGDCADRCHRGFRCFVWFMKIFRPRFLIHGHVHLYDSNARRVYRYRGTQVINVFRSYNLEIEKKET